MAADVGVERRVVDRGAGLGQEPVEDVPVEGVEAERRAPVERQHGEQAVAVEDRHGQAGPQVVAGPPVEDGRSALGEDVVDVHRRPRRGDPAGRALAVAHLLERHAGHHRVVGVRAPAEHPRRFVGEPERGEDGVGQLDRRPRDLLQHVVEVERGRHQPGQAIQRVDPFEAAFELRGVLGALQHRGHLAGEQLEALGVDLGDLGALGVPTDADRPELLAPVGDRHHDDGTHAGRARTRQADRRSLVVVLDDRGAATERRPDQAVAGANLRLGVVGARPDDVDAAEQARHGVPAEEDRRPAVQQQHRRGERLVQDRFRRVPVGDEGRHPLERLQPAEF